MKLQGMSMKYSEPACPISWAALSLRGRVLLLIPTAQGADLPAGLQHQAAAVSHQQSQTALFKNTVAAPPPFLGEDTPLLQTD